MKRHRLRVSSTGQTLLNLGCGARFHPDWNNLDFVPSGKDVTRHNILSGLPYADASFDAVYSAHFLEHLSPEQVRFVLGEILRTLKTQGVVRVVMPDLEYNARLYLESLQVAQCAPTPTTVEHYEWASLT
jgi:predicted SAM-dependent methyltransferase